MATPYKILADGVIDKLESSGYPNISENTLDSLIYAHMRSACVKFKACKKDLSDRDDLLETFNVELDDEEIDILVEFLLIEYLSSNYINTPSLLRSALTNKDMNAFSPERHLSGLKDLRRIYEKEVRQKVSAYSNSGSDLFDRLKQKRNRYSDSIEPDE